MRRRYAFTIGIDADDFCFVCGAIFNVERRGVACGGRGGCCVVGVDVDGVVDVAERRTHTDASVCVARCRRVSRDIQEVPLRFVCTCSTQAQRTGTVVE